MKRHLFPQIALAAALSLALGLSIMGCGGGSGSPPSPIITTIAGDGTEGYSGDGGPAINAQLSNPTGVAVDCAGNIYIADPQNNRIRKVATDGTITTIAGNGTPWDSGDGGLAINAGLYDPSGVAVDSAGNVYISDGGNQRIRKVATDGIITTIAGNGTPGYSGDGGPAINAQFRAPLGIAVDFARNVYIADFYNYRVRKVAKNGIITTIAGDGTPGYSGDGGPAIDAQLRNPSGVAVDFAGNVYIADPNNHRVRKVATDGTITTIAGNGTSGYSGDGGPAINAQLFFPYDVAVDSAGNVYIADMGNHRIRKLGN